MLLSGVFLCVGLMGCGMSGALYSKNGADYYPPMSSAVDHTNQQPDAGENRTEKINPWEDTAKDNLSTFAIDVDTASYTYSRRNLRSGRLPPPDSVRVEEFVNFFDYKYEGPKTEAFKLYADGAISPYNAENYILRIALQGRRMTAAERRPLHLTFLIDTSGSMSGEDRIELAKKSLYILLEQLKDADTVAIATYAGSTQKILEPTSATKKDLIRNAIKNLKTGGGTAMGSGMELAYEMASKSFVKGHENRVVVLSDGDANIGRTSFQDILDTIDKYVKQGITMTTVGFGMGNYRDNRMEQLSNKGNGNSYYIDSEDEAKRIFGDKFISTMVTIARDVKVQVEFEPQYVSKYRLIGYENRDIADKDFRNDKVDAGELGAGHTVTALYEIQLHQQQVIPLLHSSSKTPLITVRLRYKTADATVDDKATEIVAPVPCLDIHRPFAQAEWRMQWATAVMSFAEILRQSSHAQTWTLDQVLLIAKNAQQKDDSYHQELIELIGLAQRLK
jgi:Ca-activated chloride channel family protein